MAIDKRGDVERAGVLPVHQIARAAQVSEVCEPMGAHAAPEPIAAAPQRRPTARPGVSDLLSPPPPAASSAAAAQARGKTDPRRGRVRWAGAETQVLPPSPRAGDFARRRAL